MKKGIDKQTVVHKACEIVDQEGLEALSLARLAAELSIKSPSLYNHVRSLSDLKKEIALVGAQQVGEALSQSMVGKSGKQSVKAGVAAFRNYILSHPGIWKTLSDVPGKQIEQDPYLNLASEKIIRTIAAGLDSYKLPQQQLIHAIRCLRSLVHGFTSLELAGGFGMPIAIEESFDWMVETVLKGLEENEEAGSNR